MSETQATYLPGKGIDDQQRLCVMLHHQVKPPMDGFTLLEIIFSILLIGVMVISITGAYMTGRDSQHFEQTQQTLEKVIRNRMEELISRSYEAVADGSDNVTIRGQKHTISWTVTHPDLDNDSIPDSIAKQITITSGKIRITTLLIDSRRLVGNL